MWNKAFYVGKTQEIIGLAFSPDDTKKTSPQKRKHTHFGI
jgi:hypothetical protein